MSKNYFEEKTDKVEELKHFPFKNFEEFKEAVKTGEIMDFGIAMDRAREWVTRGVSAPKGWMYVSTFLIFFPWLLVGFYIVMAFITGNFWLLPYSIIPIIFMFFANPIGRKAFKIHYYFIGAYIILGFFINELWSLIYWLPLVLEYLALNQLYGGSAQIVRENLPKKEHLLAYFWKWGDLTIYTKSGVYTQRYENKGEINTFSDNHYYVDIEKEWKEYVDKNLTTSSSSKSVPSREIDPRINDAVDLVSQYDHVSASLFQRRLAINYERAAEIRDTLAEYGIVEKTNNSAPNKVLINNLSDLEKMKQIFNSLPKYSLERFKDDEEIEVIKSSDRDSIYPEVIEYIKEINQASAEILQKKFNIGYARASRIMLHLEEDGIIESTDNEVNPTTPKEKTKSKVVSGNHCPECSHDNKSTAKYCKNCGTQL